MQGNTTNKIKHARIQEFSSGGGGPFRKFLQANKKKPRRGNGKKAEGCSGSFPSPE